MHFREKKITSQYILQSQDSMCIVPILPTPQPTHPRIIVDVENHTFWPVAATATARDTGHTRAQLGRPGPQLL